MDAEFAVQFAEEWEAAWNAHDVERLLAHYTDDVVFHHHGHLVSEVLRFRGGLVSWGCGAYVPGESLAATRSLDH